MKEDNEGGVRVERTVRRPLPSGSEIDYLGLVATVIADDGGPDIDVFSHESGTKERWRWSFEGHECTVLKIAQLRQ